MSSCNIRNKMVSGVCENEVTCIFIFMNRLVRSCCKSTETIIY